MGLAVIINLGRQTLSRRLVMHQTIFELGKELSDEELGKRVREFRTRINVTSQVNHKKVENQLKSLTITYNDFPRTVYCNLTNISLKITQEVPLGSGTYALNLNQDCTSKYDNNIYPYSDWEFTAYFYDATNALLANFGVGSWYHVCGNRGVTLPGNWSYNNAADLAAKTTHSTLVWTHKDTVLPC
jgi:hypothetical protein